MGQMFLQRIFISKSIERVPSDFLGLRCFQERVSCVVVSVFKDGTEPVSFTFREIFTRVRVVVEIVGEWTRRLRASVRCVL